MSKDSSGEFWCISCSRSTRPRSVRRCVPCKNKKTLKCSRLSLGHNLNICKAQVPLHARKLDRLLKRPSSMCVAGDTIIGTYKLPTHYATA